MSKIPYVIQEDSPNLVIVPTVTCYKPSSKKTKPDNISPSDSTNKVSENVQASEKSALIKSAGVKVKPQVSSVNKNVLIDVSSRVKRQPNSWATNFLQSIGGSASKLPRAYNWHSSGSKPAFLPLRNEIQPITYSPVAYPGMFTNTTQPNAKTNVLKAKPIKEQTPVKTNTIASQPKSNKELTPIKTNTIVSQPKLNNNFSKSNGTHETIKSKTLCFPPKPNKETHHPIDIAPYLPTLNRESSHLKASTEATKIKTTKEAQLKSTKEVAKLKAKKELAHLIAKKELAHLKAKKELAHLRAKKELAHLKARKELAHLIAIKKTNTKATLQTKVHKEATKLRGNSEAGRTKDRNKAIEPKIHKEKFKETVKMKPSKTETTEVNRENVALTKVKVDGKKITESVTNKSKQFNELDSKKNKRESSKSSKNTSPLKSVVKKINHTLDSPQYSRQCEPDRNSHDFEKIPINNYDADLRAKLKRKAPKNETCVKKYEGRDKIKHNTIFPTMPNGKGFVPDDNLIISFENEKEEVIDKMKPVKPKTRKHQSGGNKCKKIKLEINIVFQKNSDTSDDDSSLRGDKEGYESFPDSSDLSFLDDFNVDEIAESLNDCQSNIIKTVTLNNITKNEQTLMMDVALPISNDENSVIRKEVCISKDELVIENNNTITSVLCNEKSSIETEKKASVSVMEVQSLTDHNGVTKNNNDSKCEWKSKNMLELQKQIEIVKGEVDRSSNAIVGVKTEFILKDSIIVKEELSKDRSVTNSNKMKLSESVIVPADTKLNNNNILTTACTTPKEVNSLTSSAQLSKSSNILQKKNGAIDKSTNIDSDKHVKNLTADSKVILPQDIKNNVISEDKVKTVKPANVANNSKHKDDVILIEDSDDECHVGEVKEKKYIAEKNKIDENNIIMWLDNKISQDMEKEAKISTKGQKDDKLKGQDKPDTTDTKTLPAEENHDDKIRMWVVNKGDIRTNIPEQNQPKTNPQDTKDGVPKTPAKEKQDNKSNMSAKGDPRNKQNHTKTNSQGTKDGKPKTSPKGPNKYNPQAERINLTSELAHQKLLQVDCVAQILKSRMRAYFGGKIVLTDLIHSGEFSTIYSFKDSSGAYKTVKQIKSSWQIGASKEAMMVKLQNGVPEGNYNCVRHYSGFSEGGLWCYVMEYYPKNLQEVMHINNKSFHIDRVQEFSRQLVAAVTILRNNNIIHSDINPLHILINDSETRLKLCGFDRAFYYNGDNLLPNVGTVNYRAPELILGFHADYSIDVWATALVMYEMATNRQLFPGFYNNDILYKQFCTVANFPHAMVQQCYYRNQHFMGDAFVRIVGSRGEGKVLVHNFFYKERIHSVLLQAYYTQWAKCRANKPQDKAKIIALGQLLSKMLVMDPRKRIPIEFVFADPFVYEMS